MKIHIVSPPYHSSSGGIKVLHYLGYLANWLGHSVDMRTLGMNPDWGPYHKTVINPDIYIHPEINPATTPEDGNIVRWALYYPGRIAGPVPYPEHELVYSFHTKYLEETQKASPHRPVKVFCLSAVELPGFTFPVERTNLTCFWEGKGDRTGTPTETQANEITRGWPAPRSELIKFFKQCKTLYSCDPCSAINDEAIMCGCKVMLWDGKQYNPYTEADPELVPMEMTRDLKKVELFLNEVAKHFWIKE
jgi:hypothetical protein